MPKARPASTAKRRENEGSISAAEERGLLSRTAAGNRAWGNVTVTLPQCRVPTLLKKINTHARALRTS